MEKTLKLIIEAVLFAADKPLGLRELHRILPEETPSEIKKAVEELKSDYEALGRSFTLKEVAQGYQFRTQSDYALFILRMIKTSPNRLSRAAMETLAIIAYKQPILRQEVERLRGVDVGGILRTLMEKGLIKIVGRKNLPGKPLIYGTTKKFLEVFDLKDLDSLPKLKEIEALGSDEDETGPSLEPEATPERGEAKEESDAPAPSRGGDISTPED
ncbi:MAG: SMC-Scp complex subunit ScpB [Deltaproteobacteria bacterium]